MCRLEDDNDSGVSNDEPNEEWACVMSAKWTPPEQPLSVGCYFPNCSGCTSSYKSRT